MTTRKNGVVLIGFVLSVSLLASSVTAMFLSKHYRQSCTRTLAQICWRIADNLHGMPETEEAVLAALLEYTHCPEETAEADQNIFLSYGYQQIDFLSAERPYDRFFVWAGFMAGGMLFLGTSLLQRRRDDNRIRMLTEYLEKINTGGTGILCQTEEGEFARLQDEIYKTVTMLYQTREAAVRARNDFAENLYNIAHQIKTPITAISLTVQMMREHELWKQEEDDITPAARSADGKKAEPEQLEQALKEDRSISGTGQTAVLRVQNGLQQIMRQVAHMSRLEEALLLLSRLDAGTLCMERKDIDVFTLLTLAAENLQELFGQAEVSAAIPESEEMLIYADMDWTMEAVMNLLKNCMEHTPPGGAVHCSYEQNPLYTRICIWDTGTGFAKEDIPHLFKRLYRGKEERSSGISIGLALAREIVERQNGTLTARNLPEGGACFEIRFYCH